MKVLLDEKHIDLRTATDWRSAGDERNELMNAAMWNVDVFSSEHMEFAVRRARQAEALARRLGRLVAKSGKRTVGAGGH